MRLSRASGRWIHIIMGDIFAYLRPHTPSVHLICPHLSPGLRRHFGRCPLWHLKVGETSTVDRTISGNKQEFSTADVINHVFC